jgi:hypothetical protein
MAQALPADRPDELLHVGSLQADARTRRNVPLTPRAKAVLEIPRPERPERPASCFVFPGPGKSGHIVTVQHSHERAISRANTGALAAALQKPAIEPFEFYCCHHTRGTRWVESVMDKLSRYTEKPGFSLRRSGLRHLNPDEIRN